MVTKCFIRWFLFVTLLLSCSGKTTESLKSSEDSTVSLPVMKHYNNEDGIQYFIQSVDGRIYITDGHYLHHLFDDKYSNEIEDYDSFLSSLSNGPVNIILDDSVKHLRYYSYSFYEDKEISAYYKEKGLVAIQKKYCINGKDDNELFFKSLPVNTKLTIAYYHWKNGYTYHNECVSGLEYLSIQNKCKKEHAQ